MRADQSAATNVMNAPCLTTPLLFVRYRTLGISALAGFIPADKVCHLWSKRRRRGFCVGHSGMRHRGQDVLRGEGSWMMDDDPLHDDSRPAFLFQCGESC